MTIDNITTIANSLMSIIAVIIAIVKNKKSNSKTIEQIAEEVNAKAQKNFEKQCKKNKIEITNENLQSINKE